MEKLLEFIKKHKIKFGLLTLLLVFTGVYFYISSYAEINEYIETDIFVYGGTLGGSSSAIVAAEEGNKVILVSENNYLAGQASYGGLSAFDESGRNWEDYSIYAQLKEFIKNKYKIEDTYWDGIGNAVVGSLSALPVDIEEFFSEKTSQTENLRTFKEFELKNLTKEGNQYVEAYLVNKNNTRETKTIRFKYLVDGTQTGKLFSSYGTEYNIGFDKKEDTNEPSAMTTAVRDFFINGFIDKSGRYGGFGNRVQAVSVALPVIDKGFSGTLIKLREIPSCLQENSKQSFIDNNKVYSAKENCNFEIQLSNLSEDAYNLNWINHGSINLNLEFKYKGASLPFKYSNSLNSADQLIRLTTIPVASADLPTIKIFLNKGELFEGFVLEKINSNSKTQFAENLSNTIKLESIESKHKLAFLIVANTDITIQKDKIKINNQNIESVIKIANDTYLAESSYPQSESYGLNFFGGLNSNISQILKFQTTLNNVAEYKFEFNNADKFGSWLNTDSKSTIPYWLGRDKAVLSWSFTPSSSGKYLMLFKPNQYTGINGISQTRLFNETTGNRIITSKFDNNFTINSYYNPLGIIELTAGNNYRMIFENISDLTVFTELILVPADNPVFKYISADKLTTLKIPKGVYDVWVRGSEEELGKKVKNSIGKELNQANNKFYTYLETVFSEDRLNISAEIEMDFVLVPNTNPEINSLSVSGNVYSVGNMDPGRYRIFVKTENVNNFKLTKLSENGVKRENIDMIDNGESYFKSKNYIYHKGGDFNLSFENISGNIQISVIEDIPSNINNKVYSYAFPLLVKSREDRTLFESQTFFNFRNLISPKNLLNQEWQQFSQINYSNETRGVSIIMTAFSDYAPVLTNSIDDATLYINAKDFSYGYYYWIRNYSPNRSDTIGCDINSLICNQKRIVFAPNIYQTPDGFPEGIYVREARRLVTKDMLDENDLILDYVDCFSVDCTGLITCKNVLTKRYCLAKDQKPALFEDAIAAVYYDIDIHSYLSREEESLAELRKLTTLLQDKKLITSREELLFYRYANSKPAEITLGSLIPSDNSNIYPASTNFGVTQIANAYLRTHNIEMSVGISTGYMLSYSLKNNLQPHELYDDKEEWPKFRDYLIEKGIHIYPLDDIDYNDKPLVKAVNKFVSMGKITPKVEVDREKPVYKLYPQIAIEQSDRILLPEGLTINTVQELINWYSGKTDLTLEQTLDIATRSGIVVSSTIGNDQAAFLKTAPTKSVFYKAIYLKLYEPKK